MYFYNFCEGISTMARTIVPSTRFEPFGRPRKYTSPEEMQDVIDEYFESCFEEVIIEKREGNTVYKETRKQRIKPYTIAGLALALNMTTQSITNYAELEGREDFFDIIKRAKQIVEEFTVCQTFSKESSVAGPIFVLKANYGYKDKTEVEVYGKDGAPINPTSVNLTLNDARAKQTRERMLTELNQGTPA